MEKVKLSYKDPDFMGCREARVIRILSEYIDPERRFHQNNINHTVVFFGSARIKPDKEDKMSKYYWAAEELAFKIADWSKNNTNPENKTYICTGGGPGIMEAANRGAHRAKEKTIGLNIALPFEQHPNDYISPELNFEFHYFYMRKLWFLYLAKALIAFPGGFGTMDELFETLTLMQTQKVEKHHLSIILFGKEFWTKMINFDHMIETGLISPEDTGLFKIIDTVDEAFNYLIPHIESTTSHVNSILSNSSRKSK